ncbi:MAG TPA: P1 family peptidase [Anaerolineae bacterium]|nr:P1 family peptidase [Anaerolineae bacterium]
MTNWKNAITDVPGIKVGHAHDPDALTGVTVVLCEEGAVGGVDQRGGAPGTRETDLLRPMHLVQHVHAVALCGGSAFGLDAAAGVMKYLEEQGVGFDAQVAKVPIVPAAVLFDLGLGKPQVRPDAAMGYAACQTATSAEASNGNVGAGMGATVGKVLGMDRAMKAGVGTASIELGNGLIVGALFAVNVFGDVVDPDTGRIIAGARQGELPPGAQPDTIAFADTLAVLKSFAGQTIARFASASNTGIGVAATNAALTKEEVNKVAQMAQDGLARVIRPAHTLFDGDTIFALATGKTQADVNVIGAYAAEVTAQAIVNAVRHARSAGGIPGLAG